MTQVLPVDPTSPPARPARLRRGPRLAALASVLFLVAGCGIDPGAAARMDGASISQNSVSERANQVITEASTRDVTDDTYGSLHRIVLTGQIRHQLIQTAAAAEQVSVSDAAVNTFLDSEGRPTVATSLLVPMADVAAAAKDFLLLRAIVARAGTTPIRVPDVQVGYDQVQVDSLAQAQAQRQRFLADPSAMNAAKPTHYQVDMLTIISAAIYGLFTATPGQIVVVPTSQTSAVLLRITSRTTSTGLLTSQTLAAAQEKSSSDAYNLAALVLAPYAARAGIGVNPRYGVWDPASLQVVQPTDGS